MSSWSTLVMMEGWFCQVLKLLRIMTPARLKEAAMQQAHRDLAAQCPVDRYRRPWTEEERK